mmetsp:Transcript_92507/g.211789  ORF Transcript_92507/g.211789 Transcript_92507/m.211789 type:complete len:246 (+) Transcript_92507:5720-6457(+)
MRSCRVWTRERVQVKTWTPRFKHARSCCFLCTARWPPCTVTCTIAPVGWKRLVLFGPACDGVRQGLTCIGEFVAGSRRMVSLSVHVQLSRIWTTPVPVSLSTSCWQMPRWTAHLIKRLLSGSNALGMRSVSASRSGVRSKWRTNFSRCLTLCQFPNARMWFETWWVIARCRGLSWHRSPTSSCRGGRAQHGVVYGPSSGCPALLGHLVSRHAALLRNESVSSSPAQRAQAHVPCDVAEHTCHASR